jgi:hypothetical protein
VDDTTGAASNSSILNPVTTTWQSIQVSFTATATGKVRIRLGRTAGTGTLYWDDIEVLVSSPAGANLAFESASPEFTAQFGERP